MSPPREEEMDPPNWGHPLASQRGSLAPEKRLPLETLVQSALNKPRGLGRETSKSGSPTEQTHRTKLKKGEHLRWSLPGR